MSDDMDPYQALNDRREENARRYGRRLAEIREMLGDAYRERVNADDAAEAEWRAAIARDVS